MDGKIRYYLIACGTSNYKNLDDNEQLASVETDLKRVVNLFTHNFGYEQVLSELQLNPKAQDLKEQFADWLLDEQRCETDIVIFYYSGHGEYLQGDRHYLLLEDTDPKKIGQTSLPTEDLVRPLKNEGVKIAQILYIIDTCFSQSGAGDITEFASSVIQQYQPIKGANIAVHAIAACRAKQTAEENVFSNALEEILKDWRADELKGGYIYPSELVDKINKRINSSTQRVVHNNAGSETSAKFFPFIPPTLQTWEEKSPQFVYELFCILNTKIDNSLYFVNSFLLQRNLCERFLLNDKSLLEKLKEFSNQPVSKEICPLIACSEWCRLRFDNSNDIRKYNPVLAQDIKNWQDEVIEYREGVDLHKIKKSIEGSFNEFKERLRNETPRLQVELEPELDKNNTGNFSGSFIVNMNLWIESKNWILGRFPEQLRLEPKGIEQNGSNKSEILLISLKQDDCLSHLIRIVRHSLSESLGTSISLELEFFLPFEFFQIPLENVYFKYTKNIKRALGKEYPIYINSWERYFDPDSIDSAEKIKAKKRHLWGEIKKEPKNFSDDDLEKLEIEPDPETLLEIFDSYDLYLGTSPSESILIMVDAALPIAVWSRNVNKPLVEGDKGDIKISEWKDWPRKIHDLRKQRKDVEITLFWDDLYSKPSERLQPLDTKLVEENAERANT